MEIVIVRLSQPGHIHVQALDEVVQSVIWGLRELGHSIAFSASFKWTAAWKATDVQPIVFGAHLHATDLHGPIPDNAIIYNLEPHTSEQFLVTREKAVPCREIWDYALPNMRHWSSQHNVQHVPVSYAPSLTCIDRLKETDRDIDVLFYGWPNERRQTILAELRKTNLKVHHVDNVYSLARNELLSRTKVVLNVHYYMPPIFEMARVSLAWANRVAVVSEESGDLEMWQRASMVTVPYESLAAACVGLVNLPGVREEIEEMAFLEFKKRDVRIVLEAALRGVRSL